MSPARSLGWSLVRGAYGLNRRRKLLARNRPRASDAVLLEAAIARLRREGFLEYRGEFGAELTTFIPFVNWLKAEGLMRGRRLVTYVGMRPYYYFLDDGEFAEKPGPRVWVPINSRDWPANSTYSATRKPWHVYPDYRTRYASEGRAFAKPVMFIQNKFAIEEGMRPVNFLQLKALERLLAENCERFDIVYSRPRTVAAKNGYVADGNAHCDYPDLALVESHPSVLDLEGHCARHGLDYNLAKLQTLAKSHVFVAVQGGGAHLLACFDRSLLLLLDFKSGEFPHAYGRGPYKYLSDPPLVLLVARSDSAFDRGLDILQGVRVVDGVVRFTPGAARALPGLRM